MCNKTDQRGARLAELLHDFRRHPQDVGSPEVVGKWGHGIPHMVLGFMCMQPSGLEEVCVWWWGVRYEAGDAAARRLQVHRHGASHEHGMHVNAEMPLGEAVHTATFT